jgi:hypothetical protein
MAFLVNNNECKAGGIIAYTKKNEKTYFLMINNTKKNKHCDKNSNFYEDPGGKFEKTDFNLISGMCREFEEETSLSYYQFNNDVKITIGHNTNNLIMESSLKMSKKIKNTLKLIFLPKSKYALGFLEVNPNFMDLKIKKYETLSDKEKKENRSLEWIKSDKFLFKKLHPRLFYNKNLIIDFLRENELISDSPVTSPTRSPTRSPTKSYTRSPTKSHTRSPTRCYSRGPFSRSNSESDDFLSLNNIKKLNRKKSDSFFRDDCSSEDNSPVTSPYGHKLDFNRLSISEKKNIQFT